MKQSMLQSGQIKPIKHAILIDITNYSGNAVVGKKNLPEQKEIIPNLSQMLKEYGFEVQEFDSEMMRNRNLTALDNYF